MKKRQQPPKKINSHYAKYEWAKHATHRKGTVEDQVIKSLSIEELNIDKVKELLSKKLHRKLTSEELTKLKARIRKKLYRYNKTQKSDLGGHEDSSPSNIDQNIDNNLQEIEEEEVKQQNQNNNNLSNYSQGAALPDDQTISEEPSNDLPPNEIRISNQAEMAKQSHQSEAKPVDIPMIEPQPQIKARKTKQAQNFTAKFRCKQAISEYDMKDFPGQSESMHKTLAIEIEKDLAKKVYNFILSIQGDKDMVHNIYEVPGKTQAITRNMALSNEQQNTIQASKENKSDQLSYGQYTAGALCNLFKYLKAPTKLNTKIPLHQAYQMNVYSIFLDIGSGFGYPCFLASLLCQCFSIGVELCQVRYNTSLEAREKLEKNRVLNVQGWASLVCFEMNNATLDQDMPFMLFGEHITHIFSYNYVQVKNDHFMKPIVKRLNLTDFRLLAWCVDEHKCRHYNLENVQLVQKLPLTTHGAGTTHMIYVYAKKLRQEILETPQCEVPVQSQQHHNSQNQQDQVRSILITTPKTVEAAEQTLIGKRVVRDFSPKYEEFKSTNASIPSYSLTINNIEREIYKQLLFKKVEDQTKWKISLQQKNMIEKHINGKICSELSVNPRSAIYQGYYQNKSIICKIFFYKADLITEIAAYGKLHTIKNSVHTYFVGQIITSQQDVQPYYMIMEQYDLTLTAWLKNSPIPIEVLRYQFLMIAHAIGSCHLQGIAHCDIKTENIVLDENLVPRLIDFGLAYLDKTNQEKRRCGTKSFMAPEVANNSTDLKSIDFKLSDLWSFGMLMYCCVYRALPFGDMTIWQGNYDHLPQIDFKCPKYLMIDGKPHPLFYGVEDLIKRLLVLNPKQRLQMKDIKSHQWFSGIQIGFRGRPNLYQMIEDADNNQNSRQTEVKK